MVKQGYKQTEVGLIPEDWDCAKFGEKVKIYRGGSPRPIQDYITHLSTGINWIKIGDVGENDKYIRSTQEKIIPEGVSKSREVRVGDFILSNSMSFGRPYILDIDGCIHDGWLTIQEYKNTFHTEYLYYLLSSNLIYQQYISMAAGSSVKNLNKDKVFALNVIYPTLLEQERIAEALSDVDSLISSLEKLIAKKKAVKQGAMQELLTGKKRLPGFTGEWHHEPFGKLCTICRGGSPRPIQDYLTTSDSGINWIKIGDVKPNAKYITSTQEKIVESGVSMSRRVYKGDFILSNSMSFGRPYILKLDGCIHDGWLAIQDYQVAFDTDFLYYVLGSNYVFEQYIQMAAGSSVQNLNKEKVAQLKLYIPALEEQTAIASILSDMDNEIEALEQKLEKTHQIKQGMMQQLLTGKIRLV